MKKLDIQFLNPNSNEETSKLLSKLYAKVIQKNNVLNFSFANIHEEKTSTPFIKKL